MRCTQRAIKSAFQVTRLDLTAIDKWKVASEGFTIGKYLNCGGPFIPRWYSDVSVSSDISLGQGHHRIDGFNKKVNAKVVTSVDQVEFTLNTSFGVTRPERPFDELIEDLHRQSVDCFEGMITDLVRDGIMGGRR